MDGKKSSSVSEDYQDLNFPKAFRDVLVGDAFIPEAFVNECLQKIYQSGLLPGTRLLDFGSGPVVHRIASASLQFKEIVLSDVSAVNRDEARKWLRGDKDALDWTPLLEQCARAEGCRDLEQGVIEIERRIREAVKEVVHCDALSENILPDGLGQFDVINTSRCLEICCSTTEEYKEVLKKLTKYLKKGGALVMASAPESRSYVAHKTLQCFYITEDSIKEALVEAGLELRDWFCWRDKRKYESFNYGGFAVHYSIKT